MQKHIVNYRKRFNIGDQDVTMCEVCGSVANSIHHIVFKSQCGTNEVDNLIAFCQHDHDRSHGKVKGKELTREQLQEIVKKRKF